MGKRRGRGQNYPGDKEMLPCISGMESMGKRGEAHELVIGPHLIG